MTVRVANDGNVAAAISERARNTQDAITQEMTKSPLRRRTCQGVGDAVSNTSVLAYVEVKGRANIGYSEHLSKFWVWPVKTQPEKLRTEGKTTWTRKRSERYLSWTYHFAWKCKATANLNSQTSTRRRNEYPNNLRPARCNDFVRNFTVTDRRTHRT